ncbi:DUF4865 family protein [Nakamurella endophytica]|uniref:DUF4865 domain-containing protein n=1 Tax=Nakamurella endophytica TaxID=1748367 RepID=A0A917SQQ4_9ACTN|nr:DUF4865 family protein [Nakamurella endophytica]GGL93149.1 DUF4865 domain-containing protein [Nakamurella endophytica]
MTAATPGQLLLHYPITLPRDYDMAVIRERVATRGAALDGRAGLAVKAYCIREHGVAGSPVHQYAPFYLWDDAGAAADFLWRGAGFQGIVADFGRPVVHTWVPQARADGAVRAGGVRSAVLRSRTLAADADLVATARELSSATERRAGEPGVHLAVAGIDPTSWRSVEFWTSGEPATDLHRHAGEGATVFTVLHVSQPGAPR